MNKKTRIFLVASALTLSVGLCTGLLAYYGGLPTMASTREAGPDELKFVPADAAIVAYANVREVMASEFRQTLRQILPDGDKHGQEQFENETGIKVEEDIDSVTACMWPNASADGNDASGFVMLRGRFDNARLEAKAREHKDVQIEEFHGARLLRLTHDGPDRVEVPAENGTPRDPKTFHHRKSAVLAFVEPGLLMFGEEAAVKRALSRSAQNVQTNEEMMGMIADVEGNANLWAVGRVEALAKNGKLPEQVATQLSSVTWFSASSRINGGLSAQLRAEARDDEAAKNLREVLQGFMALAKMQAGNKPEMQSLMQSLQLSGSGKTVALSFQVPTEFINAMASKHHKPVE
jgi:hypothetical protein